MADSDIIFTAQLLVRELLKRAVVLIKVIQSIVHLGIIKVDIKSEFDITTLVCVSELLASLIIAQIKLAQLVGLIVEYVAK
mgnify:CR=1 FL=1